MKLSVLWPLNTGECMGRFDYNPLKQNYILKKNHFKKTLQGRSKNKSAFIRHGDKTVYTGIPFIHTPYT